MGESTTPRDGVILLVDDLPRNTDLFEKVLRMQGFAGEVAVARDGVGALEYLSGTPREALPRLVVLDMNMPRMGGLETLRRIRADRRTAALPVVMFSSSNAPEDVAEAYRLGANSYVDKVSSALPYPELVRQISTYWLRVNEAPPPPERYPARDV